MTISSGCINSTPVSSPQVITEQPPLKIRWDKLGIKYYNKVKNLLQNLVSKFITLEEETIYANKNSPSVPVRIKKHTEFNLENKSVRTDFSKFRLKIKEYTLGLPSTRINLPLTVLLKNKTPTKTYQSGFKTVFEEKYKGWKHIFRYTSKSEIGVGVAAFTGSRADSASLTTVSWIFAAETYAIHLPLNTISATKGDNFTVSTDSKSWLQTFQKQIPTNSEVRKLKQTMANCEPTEIR